MLSRLKTFIIGRILETFKYNKDFYNKQLLVFLVLLITCLQIQISSKNWYYFCIILKNSNCNINWMRYN